MASRKRTIRVILVESDADSGRPQKRAAISIDSAATNAELAREIAETFNQSASITLEIDGGFVLRGKDTVDVIGEKDVVSAVVGSTVPAHEPASTPDPVPVFPSLAAATDLKDVDDTVDRYKIGFITAGKALAHAKDTPREQSEATNGVFAFDGEMVSGSTTLRDLEREAMRVLQWSSPDDAGMDVDDQPCTHDKDELACSCPIAREIEMHGVSDTLHCRFTIDGSTCMNEDCPYSHCQLADPSAAAPPHCSLCEEALGFPCPKCLARARSEGTEPGSVIFCPLVQNAGCGHLHHAHCVGPRYDPNPLTCPSGCAIQSFPREANDLGPMVAPHLTIVWDGDKVDRIPVPVGPSSASSSPLISLTTERTIVIVSQFLEERGYARGDLSLRIHFRDAVTETVRFMHSTLVSVCPTSSHDNVGHRRFPIFPGLQAKAIPTSVAANSGPGFAVDLHTSQAPIVACGCTSIRALFSLKSSSTTSTTTTVWLYAVKRTTSAASDDIKNGKTVSKQSTFLTDAAWQPSVPQTPRGMAALLSSLYLFAHSVGQKDRAGEQKVIATAWAVMRFPPAIRTLAILLLNKIPRPEEKAALAEAVYQALKEFSFAGPAAIRAKDGRRFETARILLAHIASAADAGSTASASERPAEEISLICSVSRKRLRDPVRLGNNNSVVERAVAALLSPGGPLYRPDHSAVSTVHSASGTTELNSLADLLPTIPALTAPSALVLRLHAIGWAPREFMTPLDTAARDFIAAIKRANRGDLVSQGPLELKSVSVVAPRIVVDQQGFLAVFTGRGCGTSRDVNFFRPANGGDTEVDVNDVSHALQSVIKTREAEDTWQVDSFGGITNISRPPDEAIILCLDLSESMNSKSGVTSGSSAATDEDEEDAEADAEEADEIAEQCVEDMDEDEILDQAKEYLRTLHSECHYPWITLSDRSEPRGEELLESLAVLASRRLLVLSDAKNNTAISRVSCFVSAATQMKEQLRLYLVELLDSPDVATIGSEPFSVPRKFVDFSTGELLTNPVHSHRAQPGVFVNATSIPELHRSGTWPMGHVVPSDLSAPQLKAAVAAWIAGKDLLPDVQQNVVTITFSDQGKISTWRLGKSTTTRTLYALAHRATSARFSSFTLRIRASNKMIQESATLDLGKAFEEGGAVVMTNCVLHERKPLTVEVPCTFYGSTQSLRMIVPRDSTVLIILSYVAVRAGGMPGFSITDKMMWHGLRDCGDGVSRGTPLRPESVLMHLEDIPFSLIKLDLRQFQQMNTGARRTRKESKHLTRLHLLKELFNVFLNRASSFDTAVSLVLGLVTFSNRATQDQELTPIFENFRRQLDHKEADGDTAVYDALDSARRILTQYRPDLPNLRKRIIIVSDGEDTKSDTIAHDVCCALQRAKIIVDSVQVGPDSDPTLRAISVATGGYRFSPNTSLGDALSIFDLETMLYSGERPPRSEKKPQLVTSPYDLEILSSYPTDRITIDHFPPRKLHPLFAEPVKAASKVIGAGGGDNRAKKIMREIAAFVADPHPNIDLYVVDGDMSFLKVVLEAPKDVQECPYSGGTFLLTCNLPAGYPRDPPEVRFVTTIMHPNVSKQGKVCIAELGRLWASDITLKQIFSLVYGTLLTPDLDNPLELQASLKYYEDDGTYALAVAEATARHASKSRAQWKYELDE
ncbi:hypothetical protein FB45DRAFT_1055980 [Roridomyces roridus]|uniref:UBC core domain-containing protein n=1 Tax=Roridomyces roridus TaxID=1738132 RepID=A0AAD7FQ47_9AGAR|nr:hypothetical protein FB45DRAFT_1055980 [Roridomyces roridus]